MEEPPPFWPSAAPPRRVREETVRAPLIKVNSSTYGKVKVGKCRSGTYFFPSEINGQKSENFFHFPRMGKKENFLKTIKSDDPAESRKSRHSWASRSLDVVPAQGGNYAKLLDSCFHRKPWIPVFAE